VTWLDHHRSSESLVAQAEAAARLGDGARALRLYADAAEFEERALRDIDVEKQRTLGITAVSAISLFFKAKNLSKAETLAHHWLASAHLPSFAREQVRNLLQSIWSEQVRERSGVEFAPGQVIISVKGGQIVEGGAPLDLIVEKVQIVQSLFYRTAELMKGVPHRKRGHPAQEIKESCRPWLFQTVPGSYQFAVAVQEASQKNLFERSDYSPKDITNQFLIILRASVESPEDELPKIVSDGEYRSTFLKLTRNLSPTGKKVQQIEIRGDAGGKPLTLVPNTRSEISRVIRSGTQVNPEDIPEHLTDKAVRGVLRAVHLDQDWIEVTVNSDHQRIHDVGAEVDDVIGPMVNLPVIVEVAVDQSGGHHFRDIQLDD
jgi:hypothetical protein